MNALEFFGRQFLFIDVYLCVRKRAQLSGMITVLMGQKNRRHLFRLIAEGGKCFHELDLPSLFSLDELLYIQIYVDIAVNFFPTYKNYRLDMHRTSLMSHFFRPRLRLMNGFRMSLQNCLRNPFLFPQ